MYECKVYVGFSTDQLTLRFDSFCALPWHFFPLAISPLVVLPTPGTCADARGTEYEARIRAAAATTVPNSSSKLYYRRDRGHFDEFRVEKSSKGGGLDKHARI